MRKLIALVMALFATKYAVAAKQETAPVVYTEDKTAISVSVEQPTFIIKMKSNATTGYSWFLRNYDSNIIQPIKHIYEAPENAKLIGSPGFEVWTFHVKRTGFLVPMQTQIRFIYTRPWENSVQAKQVVFSVSTHN